MQNQSSSSSPNTPTEAPQATPTRSRGRRRAGGWRKGPLLAAAAVVAIGGTVGTGFAVQGAVASQNDRIAATAELTEATDLRVDQLDAHGGILEARAVKQAEDALAGANDTIAAAQGN